MDHPRWHQRRSAFGAIADSYDRVRPTYPAEALTWILGTRRRLVVDLGAGTGILTRQLVALGHDVLPVEPDPRLRERLMQGTPATPLEGAAEAIPLADASVDAVVAGQAYHWFDTDRAHPEIARVLRPGGIFGPLWNIPDPDVDWVAELGRRTDEPPGGNPPVHLMMEGRRVFGPEFGPAERALFRHGVQHTVDSLIEVMRSGSYYLTASAPGRAGMEAAIRDLTANHPELAGRPEFELPYVTFAYRASRVALEDEA